LNARSKKQILNGNVRGAAAPGAAERIEGNFCSASACSLSAFGQACLCLRVGGVLRRQCQDRSSSTLALPSYSHYYGKFLGWRASEGPEASGFGVAGASGARVIAGLRERVVN